MGERMITYSRCKHILATMGYETENFTEDFYENYTAERIKMKGTDPYREQELFSNAKQDTFWRQKSAVQTIESILNEDRESFRLYERYIKEMAKNAPYSKRIMIERKITNAAKFIASRTLLIGVPFLVAYFILGKNLMLAGMSVALTIVAYRFLQTTKSAATAAYHDAKRDMANKNKGDK